jgi:hypothetical protein
LSHSSTTGKLNKLWAVVASSYKVAANVVLAQIFTNFPLLLIAATNLFITVDLPVPPGPSIKKNFLPPLSIAFNMTS